MAHAVARPVRTQMTCAASETQHADVVVGDGLHRRVVAGARRAPFAFLTSVLAFPTPDLTPFGLVSGRPGARPDPQPHPRPRQLRASSLR
jgi:hypothetical protein